METNEKIERLLDMTEHPEHYTEEEMQKILADKETREYYDLIIKTDDAYTKCPDVDVDKALQEFETKHSRHFPLAKIAAIFIGILLVSGITYAAIVFNRNSSDKQVETILETIKKSQVDKNDVAEVIIKTDSPIAFDLSVDIANTSRFVIVDNYEISGGGIIEEALEDEFSQLEKNVQSRDDNWQYSYINKRHRAERYSQKPTLLLITGDISIDKKEIAKQLEKNLFDSGRVVFYSEIKNILLGLDKNPNLSKKQIMESLGELGNILLHAGNIFIVTIDDLTNEDINILKATLKGDLETIYIGFNSDIEMTPDLYLEGYKENMSILNDIKSHLGRKGIIFNSWFYTI